MHNIARNGGRKEPEDLGYHCLGLEWMNMHGGKWSQKTWDNCLGSEDLPKLKLIATTQAYSCHPQTPRTSPFPDSSIARSMSLKMSGLG